MEFLVVYHHIGTEREKAEMYTQLAMRKAADDLRRQAAEIEKLEPWPAEDALREYLEKGESSGRFLDHLVFTHGDVDVHWRLQSASPEESRDRYMCRIQKLVLRLICPTWTGNGAKSRGKSSPTGQECRFKYTTSLLQDSIYMAKIS